MDAPEGGFDLTYGWGLQRCLTEFWSDFPRGYPKDTDFRNFSMAKSGSGRHVGGSPNERQIDRQSRNITAEGAGDLHEGHEGEIVLAAFNAPDVAAVEARFMRQTLLRHAEFAARRANPLPKNIQVGVHRPKSRESGLIVHGV